MTIDFRVLTSDEKDFETGVIIQWSDTTSLMICPDGAAINNGGDVEGIVQPLSAFAYPAYMVTLDFNTIVYFGELDTLLTWLEPELRESVQVHSLFANTGFELPGYLKFADTFEDTCLDVNTLIRNCRMVANRIKTSPMDTPVKSKTIRPGMIYGLPVLTDLSNFDAVTGLSSDTSFPEPLVNKFIRIFTDFLVYRNNNRIVSEQ